MKALIAWLPGDGVGPEVKLNLVRVIAALIILGGFLLFAVGRFHWAGGIVLIIGLIGAARAQQIASYFMGGA